MIFVTSKYILSIISSQLSRYIVFLRPVKSFKNLTMVIIILSFKI